MPKSIPDVKFELHKVYKTYVDQLILSGGVADIMLSNSNIPAAGGQVEGSLRVLLSNLLPERVKVSHGHIVDKNASISYQQDILITESFFTRSLIETLDGTEFYPFEAIFSTGEIKKKWSSINLNSAIKSIKRNKNTLDRYCIPPNVLETGSTFIKLDRDLTDNPYRNPLFSFTFSLNFDKSFTANSIEKIYRNRDKWKDMPNISVILDSGIYILIDTDCLEKNELKIKLYPEFVKPYENCQWYFLRLDPEESLAYLVFMLIQHINDTVLQKASSFDYCKKMLDISITNLTPIEQL
jgi:hypothetical protein